MLSKRSLKQQHCSSAEAVRSSVAWDRAARGSAEYSPVPQPYSLCHKRVSHSLRRASSFRHTRLPRDQPSRLVTETSAGKHTAVSKLLVVSHTHLFVCQHDPSEERDGAGTLFHQVYTSFLSPFLTVVKCLL